MSRKLTAENLQRALDLIAKQGVRPAERLVTYKQYEVLKSMVDDGLITGLPYSEFASEKTIKEFIKRLEAHK